MFLGLLSQFHFLITAIHITYSISKDGSASLIMESTAFQEVQHLIRKSSVQIQKSLFYYFSFFFKELNLRRYFDSLVVQMTLLSQNADYKHIICMANVFFILFYPPPSFNLKKKSQIRTYHQLCFLVNLTFLKKFTSFSHFLLRFLTLFSHLKNYNEVERMRSMGKAVDLETKGKRMIDGMKLP